MKTKYKKNSLYDQIIIVLSIMNEDEILNMFDDIDNIEANKRFLKVLNRLRKKEIKNE